jgi:hypothetical protein
MVSHIIGRMEFCLSLTPDRMLLLAPELDAFFGSVTKTKKMIIIVVRVQIFSIRLIM